MSSNIEQEEYPFKLQVISIRKLLIRNKFMTCRQGQTQTCIVGKFAVSSTR